MMRQIPITVPRKKHKLLFNLLQFLMISDDEMHEAEAARNKMVEKCIDQLDPRSMLFTKFGLHTHPTLVFRGDSISSSHFSTHLVQAACVRH